MRSTGAALGLLLSLAASAALANQFVEGYWAHEPSACVIRDDGGDEPRALTITTTAIVGNEWGCDLRDVKRIGGSASWRARATCYVEGETGEDVFTFVQAGDSLHIEADTYSTDDRPLIRCRTVQDRRGE